MARKVAIVAKTATAVFAPYHDPEWEIWGMPWVEYSRRPDLFFDVHSPECWLKGPMPEWEQANWEAGVGQSEILTHPDRCYLFKHASPFPFDAVKMASPKRFYENTLAWQLAFAKFSHAQDPIEEVGIYGANMMGKREYLWERASVTYWIGVLDGMGIKTTIPDGSALFMSYWTAGEYGATAEKRFTL